MKTLYIFLSTAWVLLGWSYKVLAQPATDTTTAKYEIKNGIILGATCVKDQYASGTCWSFATTSFLESELLRITGDTTDLSEMFFVRNAYLSKASRYVRLHGTANFGEGGQAHDVMNVLREKGLLSEKAYSGLANGQTKPAHNELEPILSAMVGAIAKNPAGKLSPDWLKAVEAVLDVYLGALPHPTDPLVHNSDKYAQKLNPDDYVEITSFAHHPYYQQFVLEIPDNWSAGTYYNVPLDDLVEILDHSLSKGFTVVWDGDVSDKGFSHKNGMALIPETDITKMPPTEKDKWEKIAEKDRKSALYNFTSPIPEKIVTPEMRQQMFDNLITTDDHLMHITGTVYDQNGKRYFHTKNSWAADSNSKGGFVDISESYIRQNTIAIMVHKSAVPSGIAKKAGIR
jgi:bleomycin hydrolase